MTGVATKRSISRLGPGDASEWARSGLGVARKRTPVLRPNSEARPRSVRAQQSAVPKLQFGAGAASSRAVGSRDLPFVAMMQAPTSGIATAQSALPGAIGPGIGASLFSDRGVWRSIRRSDGR